MAGAEEFSEQHMNQIEFGIAHSHQEVQKCWLYWQEAMAVHRQLLEKRATYLATERGKAFLADLRAKGRTQVEEAQKGQSSEEPG